MLRKSAFYCFYATVFMSFLTDKTLLGVFGNSAQALLALTLCLFTLELISHNSLSNVFRGVWKDPWAALMVMSGLTLLVWQMTSNSLAGWTWFAVKQQLYWWVGIWTAIVIVAAGKTGVFRDFCFKNVVLAFAAGQTINLTFGMSQLPLLVSSFNSHCWYLHGTVWYPQLFSVVCVLSALVLSRASTFVGLSVFVHGYFFVIVLLSAFCIPLTGMRTGTLCIIVALFFYVILFPKDLRPKYLLAILAAFAAGCIFMAGLGESRSFQTHNSSTVARSYFFLNDLSIASKNPVFGIGMDLEKYREESRKAPYFKEFMEADPWVASSPVPHSGLLEIVLREGVIALLFYFTFVLSVACLMFRSSLHSKSGSTGIYVFLIAYLTFNAGFAVHTLSYTFQWVLLATGLSCAMMQGHWMAAGSFATLVKSIFFEILSALLDLWWNIQKGFLRLRQGESQVKKITVLGFVGIGDWMVALPVITALKNKYPTADMTVVTDGAGEQLLSMADIKVKVLRLPAAKKGMGKFVSLFAWVVKHRGELKSDVLVSLWWNLTHQFLACLLRYDHYLGFFSCRGSAITNNAHRTYFLESDLFPIHADIQGEQWFGDSQKAICLGLGLKWEPVKFAAQRFDLPEGFAHGCKIVVCQPHSLIPSKNWPEDSWIKMLTLLGQRRDDLAFLFVGSPAEAETSERVKAALAGYRVLNACDTNLSEMTGLLQKADLFIGTDSGPGHIASAVGVKSLLLYGPTKPETYRPEGFGGTALWAGASCAPCGLFTCLLSEAPKCECMDLITPLEAANAAEKLLL